MPAVQGFLRAIDASISFRLSDLPDDMNWPYGGAHPNFIFSVESNDKERPRMTDQLLPLQASLA